MRHGPQYGIQISELSGNITRTDSTDGVFLQYRAIATTLLTIPRQSHLFDQMGFDIWIPWLGRSQSAWLQSQNAWQNEASVDMAEFGNCCVRTGKCLLFALAGGNLRGISRLLWNLLTFFEWRRLVLGTGSSDLLSLFSVHTTRTKTFDRIMSKTIWREKVATEYR